MIVFASDHAGFDLRNRLMERMSEIIDLDTPTSSFTWQNLGPYYRETVDYPDFAHKLCDHLRQFPDYRGVLICGTGIGMAMVANRYPHVRCAVATSVEMAEMTRRHNDANALAMGARIIDEDTAVAILGAFIHTDYEGGRHDARLAKINIQPPEPQWDEPVRQEQNGEDG